MGLQGIVLNGILLCPFYRWLDVAFGDTHKLKRFWPAIPLKIVIIQLLYMPVTIALYVFFTPVLHYALRSRSVGDTSKGETASVEAKTLKAAAQEGCRKVEESFFPLYRASWCFWPLSDALNMRFIPVRYRPVWDSCLDVFWTGFLSYACHRNVPETLA